MYKIFLTLIVALSLEAQIVNGVKVVVKQEPITMYDVKEEMRQSGVSEAVATDNLIRKKLEALEVEERKISVSSNDVYNEIKQLAAQNKMSVDQFYDMVREQNGLNSSEFREKTKERLLSQRLYSEISYSSMSQPSEDEIKEYFELHKEELQKPAYFDVIIYASAYKSQLEKVITNPMFSSSDISRGEKKLYYERISPELAKLLESTPLNKFTPIVATDKNSFTTFYLKGVDTQNSTTYESQRNRITNQIMGQKREQVLSDYFARLRNNTDIQIIR